MLFGPVKPFVKGGFGHPDIFANLYGFEKRLSAQIVSHATADLQNIFAAVVHLESKTDAIEVVLQKIHNDPAKPSGLKLDSKTLLIAEK